MNLKEQLPMYMSIPSKKYLLKQIFSLTGTKFWFCYIPVIDASRPRPTSRD